jgi:hypothetical protein
MPAMPTVGPSRIAAKPQISEDEIVTRAVRDALNGDIPSTLRILELAADPAERTRAATKLVAQLANQSPGIAVMVASGLPTGPSRASSIEIAAFAWTQRDPDEALRWSLRVDDPETANVARRAVAAVYIKKNPREALARIKGLPPNSARDEMVIAAAEAWTHQDPNGAIGWLRDQPGDALHDRIASTVAFEIAQTNPARALEMAETLPPGRNRWLVFSAIAETWVGMDRNAAMAWANQLGRGEAHDAAIAGINTGLGVAGTRRFPTSPGFPGVPRSRSAYAMGSQIDPPAFATWLATQPQVMSRDEAILEYVRQRSSQDSGSLGGWLANLSGEPVRQRAMEIYLDEVLRGSPASAAIWIRSLSASDRSDEMVERTARRWMETDPAAAGAWLRDSNFPAHLREEILKQIPR